MSKHHLLSKEVEEARTLAYEEGGGHRRRELCLPLREVEDVGTPPKCRKDPPPARFCVRGRWRSGERRKGQCWRCAGCGYSLLACLAGVRYHGSPMMFSTWLKPTHLPKSIDIDIGWPTSLVGGERPGGSEFGCGWT